jgi:hypothetical protein
VSWREKREWRRGPTQPYRYGREERKKMRTRSHPTLQVSQRKEGREGREIVSGIAEGCPKGKRV